MSGGHPTLFPSEGFDGDEPTYGGARVAATEAKGCQEGMSPPFSSLAPPAEEPSLQERWRAFSAANPDVLRLFVRYADEMRLRGLRVGAKAVWERMRWEMAVRTQGDEFRLNNSFTAYAARDYHALACGRDGYFELRRAGDEEVAP